MSLNSLRPPKGAKHPKKRIGRGQGSGNLNPERDPVAEAWLFLAGGLLATIDHRLGGLLGDDLERVRAERRRWMLAES